MSYATLLQEENLNSQFLVVLSPRRRVDSFSVFSGSVYSDSFSFGYISGVCVDGNDLTLGTSSDLSAGEFFWDNDDATLYVRLVDDSNPNDSFTVATYELYAATYDQSWYRVPTDDTSEPAYFEPIIPKSLDIKSTTDDNFMGYMPLQSTSISFSNAFHIFEKHIYDSSFNKASIKIWRLLDTLKVENLKLVYDGFMSDVSYNGSTVSVKCFNTIDELNIEYRNDVTSFYSTDLFPNINPQFVGKPARYVYGRVDGFVPVNISYVAENFLTTDNRTWAVLGTQADLADLILSVPASPVSTATRTYVGANHGVMVGDTVWFDRVVGTDEYFPVTAVGSNYIDHDTLVGGAMASGDSVKRGFVSSITISQDNLVYTALYGRDYLTSTALAGTCSGFIFDSNLETNLTMINTLGPTDRVFCRVYGPRNTVTLNAIPFGSNDADAGVLTAPCVILIDLLRRSLGVDESRINITSFTTANGLRNEALGFAIPASSSGAFPNVKTIITDILKSSLIKLYIDDDLKYACDAHGPIGASSLTIEDEEIIYQKLSCDFQYSDVISKVTIEYNGQEAVSDSTSTTQNHDEVNTESLVARFIHGVEKEKSFSSLHFKEADAQKLADRLSYIYGDRQGYLSLTAKNRFYGMKVSDVLEVTRTKLPGFSFDESIERDRDFLVTGTTKSLNSITIELIDNKGVEDNADNW